MKYVDEDLFSERSLRTKSKIDFHKKGLTSLPHPLLMYGEPYTNLKTLDLSENDIADLPGHFFLLLPNVETLCLQYNKLALLHCNISRMKNLTTLRLDQNALTCLPNSIGSLKKLQVLSVSKNKLVSLPTSLGNLNESLQVINITENSIQLLPAELGALTSLREFYIFHNRLVSLPTSLWNLSQLDGFSFEWLRYASPPLPTHLKGTMFQPLREQIRDLLRELSQCGMRECAFAAFIAGFSGGEFCVDKMFENTGKVARKYIGRSMLQVAIIENDTGVVDALLPLKPDINFVDKDGYSALGLALSEGNVTAAKKLLEHNPNVTTGHGPSGSLVHMAVELYDSDLAVELISKGAKINLTDLHGNSPLHILFSNFDKFPIKAGIIATAILANGGNPNIENINGYSPIHVVADKNQLEGLRWIISYNKKHEGDRPVNLFDLNIQGGKDKLTPLHIASCKCNYKIVQEFISAKASTLIRNNGSDLPRGMSRGVAVINKIFLKAEKKEIAEKLSNSGEVEDGAETKRGGPKIANHTVSTQVSLTNSSCKSMIKEGEKNGKEMNRLLDPSLRLSERYRALYKIVRKKGCALREVLNNLHNLQSVALKMDVIYGIAVTGCGILLQGLWNKVIKSSEKRGVKYELYFDKDIYFTIPLPFCTPIMCSDDNSRKENVRKCKQRKLSDYRMGPRATFTEVNRDPYNASTYFS